MSKPGQRKKLVAEWNASHPIGTPVTRFLLANPRRGPTFETVTRSVAWLLGGHTAVVQVEGLAGCVMLDALVVREQAEVRA